MKRLLFIATVALLASCGSSRQAASDSGTAGFQSQPITIDGSDKDWKRPLPYSISSEKVSYSITNDNEYLYILLETKNPQQQQKIIQGGMTVWVNTSAEKSESNAVGIGYPLETRVDHDRQIMEEARPDRYKSNKPVTLEDKREYALYGFAGDSTGSYTYGDDDNPQGVKMRMDYTNDGDLIYEAALPLKTLYPNHASSSSYAAKSVAVGIFIEGLPPDAQVARDGGGGGPAIGVGGGVGFGSFGSGGGIGISIGTGSLLGGGGGGRRKLFKPTQSWQVVSLASGRSAGVKPF
jgi:Tfp pilus assembly protein PilZ